MLHRVSSKAGKSMSDQHIQFIDHPAAWRSTDYTSKDDFSIDLERRHIDALKDALAEWNSAKDDFSAVTPQTFSLPSIQDDIEGWRDIVLAGRGLVILRGFPLEGIPLEDVRLMYIGLGSHFGRPVSQSMLGDMIGDVVNIGGKDPRERAYRSSRELSLHTDRCDHLGMLCIRPAYKGGDSGYASGITVHNIILAERPDLLKHLYKGYYHHLFGQQLEGESPITEERIPIFSVTDGVPSVIYIRGYIDLAIEEGHVTPPPEEMEALDFMEEVSERPDVRLDFRLEPGEVSFTNNCLLFHTRTEFEDADDPAQRRHLMRLWLREDERPAAPGVILHKGSGIPKRDGKGTYYTPAA